MRTVLPALPATVRKPALAKAGAAVALPLADEPRRLVEFEAGTFDAVAVLVYLLVRARD